MERRQQGREDKAIYSGRVSRVHNVITVELPHVGESVTEGTIEKWLKAVGDTVEKYDPLVEVVTDKVSMEVPSPVDGTITKILVEEGETVPMGAAIAEMQVDGDMPGPQPPDHPEPSEPTKTIDTTGVLLKGVAPVGPTGSGGPVTQGIPPSDEAPQARRRYSPAVMRLAEEHNVDLNLVAGTGMSGRITRKDVQAFIDSPTVSPDTPVEAPASAPDPSRQAEVGTDEERVPLSAVRRMIATRMAESVSQIPSAWSITEVDVTGLVRLRESIKESFQQREGVPITYLPFIVKAVAEALKENPLLNSSWDGDAILIKKRINIGIAVAARDGLVVPVIHDADTLSISGLAARMDDLAGRARQGKLALQEVQGGTFTVNNTGALGTTSSQPIINFPQAAIMTTEAITKRPVVVAEDAIAVRSMMNICLTFDHRIMDGAESSAFVLGVKRRLEAVGPDTGVY